jgi:hypothetical protein
VTAPDTPSREELRLAELFWRHEARDIPALKNARDQHAFTDQSETTQARWLGYARVALAAKPADDGVREQIIEALESRQKKLASNAIDPKFNDAQREIWAELANEKLDDIRVIRALSTKATP